MLQTSYICYHTLSDSNVRSLKKVLHCIAVSRVKQYLFSALVSNQSCQPQIVYFIVLNGQSCNDINEFTYKISQINV